MTARLAISPELPVQPHDDDLPADGVTSTAEWRIAAAFRAFMDAVGVDRSDPHLRGTELRVARAYGELLRGLDPGAEPEMRTFPNEEQYAAPVSVTGIPFYSICAHHFLPFFGTVDISYLPDGSVVGLSKLARAVEYIARRPQVQERFTEQLASFLDERLEPRGVRVTVRARHLCMEMRGARTSGTTTTEAVRGATITAAASA